MLCVRGIACAREGSGNHRAYTALVQCETIALCECGTGASFRRSPIRHETCMSLSLVLLVGSYCRFLHVRPGDRLGQTGSVLACRCRSRLERR